MFGSFLRREPAVFYLTLSGQLVAGIIVFAHLSRTDAAYLTGIVTAAGTIATAVLARPVPVAIIAGAAGTLLQCLAIVNIHLTRPEIGILVSAVTFIVGHVSMRPNLTPVSPPVPAPAAVQ